MRDRQAWHFLLASALSITACAPQVTGVFGGSPSAGGGGGAGGDTGTTGTTGTGGHTGTTSTTSTTSITTSTTTTCDPTNPDADTDADGFSVLEGDCNDCDASVSPGAVEIPGNAVDENCDGQLDDAPSTCDDDIAMDSQDAVSVAGAADLCHVAANETDWGIITVTWTLADGTPAPQANLQNFHLGHGVLPNFGPNVVPRGGKKILVLSSGTARRPGDPGYQNLQGFNKGYGCNPPPGMPKDLTCPGVVSGSPMDPTAMDILLRVPMNAHGFSYDFDFYAFDFPQYICTQFNDTFVSLLSPPVAGQPDGIISFDDIGHPVTVNDANYRVCSCDNGPPCMAGGKSYTCSLGPAQLQGTGFDTPAQGSAGRAATGWLTTTVPVDPGSEITIRWGAYDAGDSISDSTVLIDHWQWITAPGVTLGTKAAQ